MRCISSNDRKGALSKHVSDWSVSQRAREAKNGKYDVEATCSEVIFHADTFSTWDHFPNAPSLFELDKKARDLRSLVVGDRGVPGWRSDAWKTIQSVRKGTKVKVYADKVQPSTITSFVSMTTSLSSEDALHLVWRESHPDVAFKSHIAAIIDDDTVIKIESADFLGPIEVENASS